MSAKPIALDSTSSAFALSQLANRPPWITTGCILAADLLTISLVLGITVLGRHFVTPSYDLRCYFDIFPCATMLLVAFWVQGLYPAVLLHPAEEMRRIFFSISMVFLVMASTTFLWRNAESYSRSVFLITWALGSPIVLLSRYLVRRLFSRQPWWGVSALVLGSGPAAQRVARTLQDGCWASK